MILFDSGRTALKAALIKLDKKISCVLVPNVICDGLPPPMTETMDEEEQCILCYKNKKNIVYEPCNHVISCYECFEKLVKKECPVCKTNITKIKGII